MVNNLRSTTDWMVKNYHINNNRNNNNDYDSKSNSIDNLWGLAQEPYFSSVGLSLGSNND